MKLSLSFFVFIVAMGIAFSSCSGNSSQSVKEEVTEEVKPKGLTPEELGGEISDLYKRALVEVTDLTKESPAATDVQPKIVELKEKYIQELVELGRKREALEDEGKSKVDLTIRMALQNAYSATTYTAYTEAINVYLDNSKFYKLLADFNIITQYSNFDLLKQQEPEEAQRLGIE